MSYHDFSGVKAALMYDGELLVYQRDSKPGLRFAGLWDFFGGGREADETPFECIRRELEEELGLMIDPSQIVFTKVFPAMHDPSIDAYFMAVELRKKDVDNLHFGSEGQHYAFVDTEEFFLRDDFVPELKPRLQSYIDANIS